MARQGRLGQTAQLRSSMPLQRIPGSYLVCSTHVHLVPQNTSPLCWWLGDKPAAVLTVIGAQRDLGCIPVLNCGGWGGVWEVMPSNVSHWSPGLCHTWGRCHSVTHAGSSGAAQRTLRQGSKLWSKCVSNPPTHMVTAESRGKCRGLLAPSAILALLTMLSRLITQAC